MKRKQRKQMKTRILSCITAAAMLCFLLPESIMAQAEAEKSAQIYAAEKSAQICAAESLQTDEQRVKAAADFTKEYFRNHRTLGSAWEVWAAYAALGEYIWDKENGYTFPAVDTADVVSGTAILQVIAMGENPYNYQGEDLVQKRIDAGLSGAWSAPIYNVLAIEAAGADCGDSVKKDAIEQSIAQMENLDWGPDMGGWGAVVASRHLQDAYEETARTTVDGFIDALKDKMEGNTASMGGNAGLSIGCVTTGLTALTAAGYPGCDVTKDENWTKQNAVKIMYEEFLNEETTAAESFNVQYMMEFCDLYNTLYQGGNVAWISCGVSAEKLEILKEKAQNILQVPERYTAESLQKTEAALLAVNAIAPEKLAEEIPAYGREYYALYDAVRFIQPAGQNPDDTDNKDDDKEDNKDNNKEEIKEGNSFGLTISGSSSDLYALEAEQTSNLSEAYTGICAQVTAGTVLSMYDVKVYDKDRHMYLSRIADSVLNIPVTGSAEKYSVLFYDSEKKVSCLTPVVENGRISIEIKKPGTYAVVGYSIPGAPKAAAASVSYNSAVISWQPVSGAGSFEIYRSDRKNGTYRKLASVTGTAYKDRGLVTGRTYYYKAAAKGTLYGEKFVTELSAAASVKTRLAKPSLKLTGKKRQTSVKWGKIKGASGYEIYRSGKQRGSYKKIKTLKTAGKLKYTDKKLKSKKKYYYKVRAYRLVKGKKVYSSYSTVRSVKVK